MKFGDNLIKELSSEAKLKVLRYILAPGFRMTGRELARISGISHTMAFKILREFEAINLVSNFRAGNSVIWTPQKESFSYQAAEELYAKAKRFMPINHLKETLAQVLKAKKVKRAVIYGSVAKGKERYSSDIDLFVLVEGQKDKKNTETALEKLSQKCQDLYGNTLHYYLMTENEYSAKKKLAVIKEIEGGIKLI